MRHVITVTTASDFRAAMDHAAQFASERWGFEVNVVGNVEVEATVNVPAHTTIHGLHIVHPAAVR